MIDRKKQLRGFMEMTADEFRAQRPNLHPLLRPIFYELAKLGAQKELLEMQIEEALQSEPETHEDWMTETRMIGFDKIILKRVEERIAHLHKLRDKIAAKIA